MNDLRAELEEARRRVRELEAAVASAEVRQLLFERALDLMCVAGTDGYFKELNSSWSKVLGFSIEELTAQPFIEFVHPDDLEATRAAATQLAKGEQVVEFQNRYRTKSGGYRWLRWNAVFEPRQPAILAVARDVTEYEETREALKASEHAYRQLFDGMLDGFSFHDMIFDQDGNPCDYRFRAVNPAFEEMTGLKAENLVGRRVLDVLPGTEQHWIDVFGGVAKTGDPVRYENYSQEFDKWFEVLAFRPAPSQFACTFHDITARKRAEAERAELQAQVEHTQKLESLGVMAGGIAHDFNNLLTAIISGVELALDNLRDPTLIRRELNVAMAASERAGELCQQMLAYAGRAQALKQSVDLTSLVREMLGLAKASLSKKLTLDGHFPESELLVVVDPAQVRQVVLNLVLNAGDAIGDNPGSIRVETGHRDFPMTELSGMLGSEELNPGHYGFVQVSDTGSGMSAETQSRIFDPFFTTKVKGRGLGLAATLGIVRGHNGGIRVTSKPGRGTEFLVVLPQDGAAARQPEPEQQRDFKASGRILLCDDEPIVRQVAARLVNSLGFDVTEAKDGHEAVEFFDSSPSDFSAVLLDMTMPRLGGLDVLPILRKRRSNVPIIIMSGYAEDLMASSAHEPTLTFLRKPFRRDELRRALVQVLPTR